MRHLVAALTLGVAASAQAQTAAQLATIRSRYAVVEREAPTLACRSFDVAAEAAEGSRVTVCGRGTQARRIVAQHLGERGRQTMTYYLWDDPEPFFVLVVRETYGQPSGHVTERLEDRYYFVDGRLVQWIGTDGRPRSTNTSVARNDARNLRADVARYRRLR